MEGKSMFQKIKEGLGLSQIRQDFHKEAMANKENMPVQKAAPEKPANTVELTDEEVEEASELADNNYTDKEQDEDKKVA